MSEAPRERPRKRRPWYGDGLRFSCVAGCGACCTRHGDYDYVYLDPDDVARLAAHLGLEQAEFRDRHAAEDDGYLVLRMDGPSCPFLEGTACAVYQARPSQCRTFPFWRENVRNRSAWTRLTAFCPGIGEGEHHGFDSIRARVESQTASERSCIPPGAEPRETD